MLNDILPVIRLPYCQSTIEGGTGSPATPSHDKLLIQTYQSTTPVLRTDIVD